MASPDQPPAPGSPPELAHFKMRETGAGLSLTGGAGPGPGWAGLGGAGWGWAGRGRGAGHPDRTGRGLLSLGDF